MTAVTKVNYLLVIESSFNQKIGQIKVVCKKEKLDTFLCVCV